MPDTEPLLPPIEIPWRLASTTQPLAAGEPAQTALSLFVFEPDDAALVGRLPGERLVFIKVTATVTPASIPRELSPVAASFLGEGIPCMHLLLDLKVRGGDGEPGSIRPYFHAASPLERRMVQTGVVGMEVYEGEADGLAVGKSGAQMNETLRSHSTTSSASASAGLTSFVPIPLVPSLLSVGGSVRSSSTDLTSDRAVSQTVDTTAREASAERRELVSHTTRVENIISLLNARYVGTPHLSFSLSPRPLQQLSVDPSDPNLWFQQLLARRSSGLEGVQEFIAVIAVPSGTNFCLSARLRRVCLLDSPPGPFTAEERFTGNLLQLARMVNYLNRTFPPGTPLEELDIDIIGGLSGGSAFRRPVVELWGLRLLESLVVASVVSPGASVGVASRGSANYKHFLEVWLDTLRDEYEREAMRSPLERGLLFGEHRFLDTCLAAAGDGGPFEVTETATSASPLFRVRLPVGLIDIGGVRTVTASASARTRALETVTRWNVLERRAVTLLASGSAAAEAPLTANDDRLRDVLLDVWRKLPPDDPRNVDFDQAAAMLKLNDAQRRLLKAGGADSLSDVATALHLAPVVERHNEDVQRLRGHFKERRVEGQLPDPIKLGLSARNGEEIRDGIGAVLADAKTPRRT